MKTYEDRLIYDLTDPFVKIVPSSSSSTIPIYNANLYVTTDTNISNCITRLNSDLSIVSLKTVSANIYISGGHQEIGAGTCVINIDNDEIVFVLTQEFVDYLNGSEPIPAHFLDPEFGINYISIMEQKLTAYRQIHTQLEIFPYATFLDSVDHFISGSAGDEAYFDQYTEQIEHIAKYLASLAEQLMNIGMSEPSSYENVAQIPTTILSATENLDLQPFAANIISLRSQLKNEVGKYVAILANNLNITNGVRIKGFIGAFNPYQPLYDKYTSELSSGDKLEAWMFSVAVPTGPRWCLAIEFLERCTDKKYADWWYLRPFLYNYTTSIPTSDLKDIYARTDSNNLWLFLSIHILSIKAHVTIPDEYDPMKIMASLQARLNTLNEMSDDELSSLRLSAFGSVSTRAAMLSAQIEVEKTAAQMQYVASVWNVMIQETTIPTVQKYFYNYLYRLLYVLFNGKVAVDYKGEYFKIKMDNVKPYQLSNTGFVRSRIFKIDAVQKPPNMQEDVLSTIKKFEYSCVAYNLKGLGGLEETGYFSSKVTATSTGAVDVAVNSASGTTPTTFLDQNKIIAAQEVIFNELFDDTHLAYIGSNSFELPEEESIHGTVWGFQFVRFVCKAISLSNCCKFMMQYPVMSVAIISFTGADDTVSGIAGKPTLFDKERYLATAAPVSISVPSAMDGSWTGYTYSFNVKRECTALIYHAVYSSYDPLSIQVTRWLKMFKKVAFVTIPADTYDVSGTTYTLTAAAASLSWDDLKTCNVKKISSSVLSKIYDQIYEAQVFVLIENNTYVDTFAFLWYTASTVTDYVSTSIGCADAKLTLGLSFLTLVALHRQISNSYLPTQYVMYAIRDVLKIVMETSSAGSDEKDTASKIVTYMETFPEWRILAGLEASSFKRVVEEFPTASNAKIYLEDVARRNPDNLLQIKSFKYDSSVSPPYAQAYKLNLLTGVSYGLTAGDSYKFRIISKPMPWNAFYWGREEQISVLVATPGSVTEGTLATVITDKIRKNNTLINPVSKYTDRNNVAYTRHEYRFTGGVFSYYMMNSSTLFWDVGYAVQGSNYYRIAKYSNGNGVFVKRDRSNIVTHVRAKQYTYDQWVSVYQNGTLLASGRDLGYHEVSDPSVIKIVVHASEGGSVVDISDIFTSNTSSTLYVDEVISKSKIVFNVVTVPNTSTFTSSSPIRVHTHGIFGGKVSFSGGTYTVGDYREPTWKVAYSEIQDTGDVIKKFHVMTAINNVLTMSSTPGQYNIPDSNNPGTFYVNNRIVAKNVMRYTIKDLTKPAAIWAVGSNGKEYYNFYKPSGWAAADFISYELNSLVPFDNPYNRVMSFNQGSYGAVAYRPVGAFVGDEEWSIFDGNWNRNELIGQDGRKITFSPDGTVSGEEELYAGLLSEAAVVGIEKIYAGTHETALVYMSGTWIDPTFTFAETFPSAMYIYTHVDSLLTDSSRYRASLITENLGTGSVGFYVVKSSAIWFLLALNSYEIARYIVSQFHAKTSHVNNVSFSTEVIRDTAILRKTLFENGHYKSWAAFVEAFQVSSSEIESIYAFDNADAFEVLLKLNESNFSPKQIFDDAALWGAKKILMMAEKFLSVPPEGLQNLTPQIVLNQQVQGPPKSLSSPLFNTVLDNYIQAPETYDGTHIPKDPYVSITSSVSGISRNFATSLNSNFMSFVPHIPISNVDVSQTDKIDLKNFVDENFSDLSEFHPHHRFTTYTRSTSSTGSYMWLQQTLASSIPNGGAFKAELSVADGMYATDSSYQICRSMEFFFDGWDTVPWDSDSEYIFRDPAINFSVQMCNGAVENVSTYPTSSIVRSLLGLSSPWFSTYKHTGSHVLLDPRTDHPVLNVNSSTNDTIYSGADTVELTLLESSTFDILFFPVLGAPMDAYTNEVHDFQSKYAEKFKYSAWSVSSKKSITSKDFDLLTMTPVTVRASSTQTGPRGFRAKLSSALLPSHNAAPPVKMFLSAEDDKYQDNEYVSRSIVESNFYVPVSGSNRGYNFVMPQSAGTTPYRDNDGLLSMAFTTSTDPPSYSDTYNLPLGKSIVIPMPDMFVELGAATASSNLVFLPKSDTSFGEYVSTKLYNYS